ncbi:MAG: YciI family protein [Candidatus Rokuibacteriota bacterium]
MGRNALMDVCFTYDDALHQGGHFVGGEALRNPWNWNATTLRYRSGKVSVTDGPYRSLPLSRFGLRLA